MIRVEEKILYYMWGRVPAISWRKRPWRLAQRCRANREAAFVSSGRNWLLFAQFGIAPLQKWARNRNPTVTRDVLSCTRATSESAKRYLLSSTLVYLHQPKVRRALQCRFSRLLCLILRSYLLACILQTNLSLIVTRIKYVCC